VVSKHRETSIFLPDWESNPFGHCLPLFRERAAAELYLASIRKHATTNMQFEVVAAKLAILEGVSP
jgi:hypothetical protein